MHTIFHLHNHTCIKTVKLLHLSNLKVNYQRMHKIIFNKTPLIIFANDLSFISIASCEEHRITLEILRIVQWGGERRVQGSGRKT
jgi:citrate lyase synthetase